MDLLTIVQSLWRHKLFAIPVILLTVVAGVYVLKIKPPVYEASSSVLLIEPQGPTAAQIAASPTLKRINPNNPYIDYGDLDVVADSVIQNMMNNADQSALVEAGVDPRYQLALSTAYGNPPIIDITGVGSSAQQAIHGAAVLARTATTDLTQIQSQAGVNRIYMIKSIELSQPDQAQLSSSGKFRSLIAVLGLGALLLFLVISVADVVEKRRMNGAIRADTGPRTRSRARAPSKVRDDWGVGASRQDPNDASRQDPNDESRQHGSEVWR